jgi:hypothetical protein
VLPPMCVRAQRPVVGAVVRVRVHLGHVHLEHVRHQRPQLVPLMRPRSPLYQFACREHDKAVVWWMRTLPTKHTTCHQDRGHRPYNNTDNTLSTTLHHHLRLPKMIRRDSVYLLANLIFFFARLLIVSWERRECNSFFNFCYR